jgi:hypothetical protein
MHTVRMNCLPSTGPQVDKTFTLQPKQTQLVRACSTIADAVFSADALDAQFVLKPENATGLSGQAVAGITITTEGTPGELAAFGFVAHNDSFGSYFSAANFIDPKGLRSSGFVFAGVPVGASRLPQQHYTPQVAVTNFSDMPQTATVLLASSDNETSGIKQVASVVVPAGASRLVALAELIGNQDWRNSFVVRSSGKPGDMMAKMMFKGAGTLPNVELIGKDEHDRHTAGDHPWTTENGMRSTLFLFNHSGSKATVTVRIGAPGSVWLKMYDLAPNETKAISIGDVIAAGTKDEGGFVTAKTISSGEVAWWAPNDGSPDVAGRVVQVDSDGTIARNFSCGDYIYLCEIAFENNLINVPTDGTTIEPDAIAFCSQEMGDPPTGCPTGGEPSSQGVNMSFSYSSANTSVATVQNNGPSSNWTGVKLGTTPASTSACAYNNQDILTGNCCGGSGGAGVTPTVTISGPSTVSVGTAIALTATGTPSGGTYSWTASNSDVTLSNGSTATVTALGSALGTSTLTVTYTVSEQSITATQVEMVQGACPTSVSLVSTSPIALSSVFPAYKTGVGIDASMNVNGSGSNYNGIQISEVVSTTSNSCGSAAPSICGYPGTPFTVGTSATAFNGAPLAAAQNTFWDQHIEYFTYSALSAGKSCSAVCSQTYSCNGNSIGTFTIDYGLAAGTLGSTPVTNVTVTKH